MIATPPCLSCLARCAAPSAVKQARCERKIRGPRLLTICPSSCAGAGAGRARPSSSFVTNRNADRAGFGGAAGASATSSGASRAACCRRARRISRSRSQSTAPIAAIERRRATRRSGCGISVFRFECQWRAVCSTFFSRSSTTHSFCRSSSLFRRISACRHRRPGGGSSRSSSYGSAKNCASSGGRPGGSKPSTGSFHIDDRRRDSVRPTRAAAPAHRREARASAASPRARSAPPRLRRTPPRARAPPARRRFLPRAGRVPEHATMGGSRRVDWMP